MKKVLNVISDLRRGGRERQLSVLVKYSTDIQHSIVLFNHITDNYLNEYGIKNFHILGNNKLKRFLKIYKLAKQNNVDVIHTWGNNETIYSLPASVLLNIPILNGSVRHGIRKKDFSHKFRSFVLRNSKYVLANSIAGLNANKMKVNKKKHFILYNGIEEKFFVKKNPDKKKSFLKEKKLSGDTLIFLSIMNFIPYKDYLTPLKSLSELKNNGKNFHYIMIGKGPMKEDIIKKSSELNLNENISIYSDAPDIPGFVSISDILIHSSFGEGCSNAILEAKAGGLLVVASDTGGTNEILEDFDFLFEYKNSMDLTDKLQKAIDHLYNDKTLPDCIQKKTYEKFSVNKLKEGYSQIINKIISG